MYTLWQDLRYGLRVLKSTPALSAVAALTIALGIASTTTVFSWTEGLLLRPYPGATDGDRLVVMEMVTAGAPNGANQTSYLDYRDYRDRLTTISGLLVHREEVFSLGDAASSQASWGELVSGNYFDVLGVKAELGRTFTPEENGNKLGAYPVVVISDRLWRTRFRSDAKVIGKTLRVNQYELTIVGVAPPAFRGTMPGLAYDLWMPVTMGRELNTLSETVFKNRDYRNMYVTARLKPGVTVKQANAEAYRFSVDLAAAYPKTNLGVAATILPAWKFHSAAPELLLKPLQILMAAAVVVLLIACANVANLLLARSFARRKELSIRLALGAGRRRLVRQLLTETLMLAGAGTLVGLPLAFWMEDLLPALVPKINAPAAIGYYLNGRILVFTILTCVITALISGAAPSLFWMRSDVNDALKEGGRSGSLGGRSHRTRSLLVMAEVALAMVSLTGAGLFLRSFYNARTVDPGFDMDRVALARFYLNGTGYSTPQAQQFCLRLRDRLRSAPGVADVAYAEYAPLGTSGGPYRTVEVEGYVPARDESMQINDTIVSPGYFSLLRTPMVEGRDFLESDTFTSEPVIVVNQTFARRYFNGANPVGRKVRCWGKWATVVGLVRDTKYFNVAEAPRPYFFAPFQQRWNTGQQLYFFIRAAGDPMTVLAGLRSNVAAIDPKAGAFDPMTLRAWSEVTLLGQKVAASMLGMMGLLSLVLAAVGLYSVMAYAITQRTQELGIRMALGAQPKQVLSEVLRRGMAMIGGGLGIGLVTALTAAVLLRHTIGNVLFRVGIADPVSFGGAIVFLTMVGFVASYVPARRATKIDPMRALRCE